MAPDGSVTMTMTKEVVEISRQPLEAALFDIPAGYTQARDQQEMFSTPSMDEMTADFAPAESDGIQQPVATDCSGRANSCRCGSVQQQDEDFGCN